jgi:hypothetical protein
LSDNQEALREEKVRVAVRVALNIISEMGKAAFLSGERCFLLNVVSAHIKMNEPLPAWASTAFLEAFESDPKSWDDVFGRPRGAGRRWREESDVATEAEIMILLEGRKVDACSFFEDLAARLKMSAGTAKRRYYSDVRKFSDRVRTELGMEEIDNRLVFVLAVIDMLDQIARKTGTKIGKC